ncbi:2'-5' RNA ligase family protein [uncultured Leifsonia sp.]|uniref:2'-5' RNA ligase family protein n=1 Tax=Leifsonia sp. TaxID=1870902 RepID=UPI0028D094D4|nr:2'-5' RNA ligase family protein [uncultured Leifsonia sp.]
MFSGGDWPLHVTIVPPFETELDAPAVAALLPRSPAVRVVAGERAAFGRHRDIPVTLLHPSPALLALHRDAVRALEAAGARIHDRHHILDGYRPHATRQRRAALDPGDHDTLTELALVERAPRSQRVVAARIPLA